MDLERDLAENYRTLHAQGRSWEQIAADADRVDSRIVAAFARSEAAKKHDVTPRRATRKPRQTRG